MQTIIAISPVASLVEKLQKKGLPEFTMTDNGFTCGNGRYYAPDDLVITRIYHFEDFVHPDESSYIYVIRDKNGVQGYSIDDFAGYRKNEDNLYHWFISKIERKHR